MIEVIEKTTNSSIKKLHLIKPRTWVNAYKPNDSEIKRIHKTTKTQLDFLRAALDEAERPRIERENNQLLVILRVPIRDEITKTIPLGIIIKDDYRILPWKEAIEKQVNSIVEESNKVKEEVEIEYLVKYEGSTFPLKSLLRERDWEEIVRAGFIIKKARKKVLPIKDFGIKLNPGSIKGKPGKKVEVKVKVEPREGGDIFVKLKPELGEVVPSEGMLPLECVWKLEIPAERGMRSIEIKVESEEQTKSELLVLTIESDTFSTTELTEEHIGMKLFEVRNIRDIELLKELNGLSERIVVFGEAKIAERDKEIKLYIKNVEGEVVEYAISQIKEVVEGVSEVNLNVYFKKEVEIDELVFHKIKQYNEKAEFKLKR